MYSEPGGGPGLSLTRYMSSAGDIQSDDIQNDQKPFLHSLPLVWCVVLFHSLGSLSGNLFLLLLYSFSASV